MKMKKISAPRLWLVALFLWGLSISCIAGTLVAGPVQLSYQIMATTDDAEEGDDGPGVLDLDSSDLEICYDHSDPDRSQTIGLVFRNIDIPQGTHIESAYIQFACDEADKNRDPFSVTIYGEASDNAATFQNTPYNISSRPRTQAAVEWKDIPAWILVHEAGDAEKTPDISSIIQEIVDRPGWQAGNSLALILEGVGTRTAESYDGTSSLAPRLVITISAEGVRPSSDKFRLSWDGDPAHTMLIAWDQLRGSDPVVYYGTEDHGTEYQEYPFQQTPFRVDHFYGMDTHFARLENLLPNTAYYFVVKDSEGVSKRFWFKTAPDSPMPFTFISGGDTKSSGQAYLAGLFSNRMVSKLKPLFVLFGGDFTSGDGTDAQNWHIWLKDWSRLTTTPDGRLIPILPVHGNHESGNMENLYHLFGIGNQDPEQDTNYTYYSLSFAGDLMKIIVLNSQLILNGMDDAHLMETQWLEHELYESQNVTFLLAAQHKPFRPHTSGKAENYVLDPWAKLFERYGVDLDFDNDSHMNKITFPVRPCREIAPGVMEDGCFEGYIRDNLNGTIYIGEGSWGATPRPADDEKPWTLYSSSVQQIKWIQVFPAQDNEPARMEIRTVITGTRDENGILVDHVSGVGENSEEDPFAIPENILLAQIPGYGTVVTVPFQAQAGEMPEAPANLSGQAVSYSEIELSWTNMAATDQVATLWLERKRGTDGEWVVLDKNITPETTCVVPVDSLPRRSYALYMARVLLQKMLKEKERGIRSWK